MKMKQAMATCGGEPPADKKPGMEDRKGKGKGKGKGGKGKGGKGKGGKGKPSKGCPTAEEVLMKMDGREIAIS